MSHLPHLHFVFVILSVLFWGLNFVLLKMAAIELTPLYSCVVRMAIASVLAIPFMRKPKGLRQWGLLMAISTLLFTVGLSLTAISVLEIDASICALLVETEVLFAVVLGAVFLKEALRLRHFVGFALALVGIGFITLSPEIHLNSLEMAVLPLLTALSYAVAALLTRAAPDIPAMSMTAWCSLLSVPQVLLLSWVFEGPADVQLAKMTPYALFIISAAAADTLVAVYFWNFLLQRHPVAQVVPYGMLIPIASLFFGYLLLGETIHWIAAIGGLLTLAGVYLQVRPIRI